MKTKTKAIAFVLVSMFLSMSLVIQPVSTCPSKSELRLELAINPGSVYQYHLITLQASLESYTKVWGGNPMKVGKAPIPGIYILFSIVDENGERTPIGGNLTGIDGVSSLSFVATQHPGHYWVEAQVNGSALLIARKALQVLQAPLSIQFESLGSVWGVNSTIRARVTTRDNHPVHSLVVEVSIYASGVWRSLGNATTGHNGTFSITAFIGYPPGLYDLKVIIKGYECQHEVYNNHHNDHNEHGGNNGHNEHGGNNDHNEHNEHHLYYGLGQCGRDGFGDYFFPRWLEVRKRATKLALSNAIMFYKDSVTLQAGLTDEFDIPTIMESVDFCIQIGGVWEYVGAGITDFNGIASVGYDVPLNVGSYNLKAEFAGDAYYHPSHGFNNLTVDQEYTTITIDINSTTGRYSDTSALIVTLSDDDVTDVISGAVLDFFLKYDNVWHFIGSAATDEASCAQLNYTPFLASGGYSLRVEFAGNYFYRQTVGYFYYYVEKEDISIIVPNNQVTYGTYVWLDGYLKDDELNPIAEKYVQFLVQNDGNWLFVGSETTDNNGHANYHYLANNIEPGTHLVKMQFDGDTFYKAGWSTDSLTIYKDTPILIWVTSPPSNIIRGMSASFSVCMTSSGGTPLAGLPVIFDIHHNPVDSFTITTNSQGIATVTYSFSAVSTYTVSAHFSGTQEYNSAEVTTLTTVSSLPIYLGMGSKTFPSYPAVGEDWGELEIQYASAKLPSSFYNKRNLYGSSMQFNIIWMEWFLYPLWVFHYSGHGLFPICGCPAAYGPYSLLCYDSAPSSTYPYITNAITTENLPYFVTQPIMQLAYISACNSRYIKDQFLGYGRAKSVIYYDYDGVDGEFATQFAVNFFEYAMQYSVGEAYDKTVSKVDEAKNWWDENWWWVVLLIIGLSIVAIWAVIVALVGAGIFAVIILAIIFGKMVTPPKLATDGTSSYNIFI